jgi:hypothetical protein
LFFIHLRLGRGHHEDVMKINYEYLEQKLKRERERERERERRKKIQAQLKFD